MKTWVKAFYGVMLALMVFILIYSWHTAGEFSAWYIAGLLIIAGAVIYILKVKDLHVAAAALMTVLTPLAAFLIAENYTHMLDEMRFWPAVLNVVLYYLIFLLFTFITGRVNIGYMIGIVIPAFAGLANYFVILFRSAPILPWDLFSVGVAASVAGNFDYVLSVKACMVLLLLCFLIVMISKVTFKISKAKVRAGAGVVSLGALLLFCRGVQTDAVVDAFNIDTTLFTPKVLYRNNGFMLGFIYNMQYLNIEKPEGYSDEYAEEISKGYSASSDDSIVTEENPNIIVIMNEAFSDLRVLGYYETNQAVMPFIDALTENTQKGWMYSSVKGGNTANTEFEFLTGSSLYYLPIGSVAYQQYIRGDIDSLASQLDDLGYTSIAMHPYYASGWNRDKVYDYLGFEEKYFLPDFTGAEKIRDYVSDASTFEKIIDLYENKSDDEKLFVFDVTMQNHGSYTKTFANLTNTVRVTDRTGTYINATDQYLTLINITDQAFKELVSYFKTQDEPTIILMFGDHQPADYVVSAVNSEKEDTLESQQKRYIVPYIMWANYDIEESSGEETSANYLGGKLLENAGLELTGYQEFLQDLYDDYPVITANAVKDAEGNYYERDSETLADVLDPYGILQYNDLVDTKNKLQNFFSLPEN